MSARLVVRLRRGGFLGLVSGAAVALTACAGSGSVDTGATTASIVVVAGDMDSQVSVVLSADDRASLELPTDARVDAAAASSVSSSDSSAVSSSGDTVTTTLEDLRPSGGAHSYAGGLDGVTEPATDVTVTLHGGDDRPAVSTVALPGPIFLVQPTAGEEVSRGRPLVLGVNEGAGSNRVEWSGPCVTDGSLDVAQGRPVVVPAGRVETRPDAGPDARCEVVLTVSRVFRGELDRAFAGGSITAQRSVAVAVRSVA